HLLLEHALVDRADGPLRPAVHTPAKLAGGAEGVLSDRSAIGAADRLRAVSELVAVRRLAPLLRAVGIAHRHPAYGDRVVDAADRRHPGDPASRAHDHLPVDRLAQDAVGASNVVRTL